MNESKKKPLHFKYFFLMGEAERRIARMWYNVQRAETERQKEFLNIVKKAVEVIDYDYRIATVEPSIRKDGHITYGPTREISTDLDSYTWARKAKEFMPTYGSRLTNIYELFLWYAYRIAKGYWTIEYVADDSSRLGNYIDSSSRNLSGMELSAVREVGGFRDGIGNSYKLVKSMENTFLLCGGCYEDSGKGFPVADIVKDNYPKYSDSYTVGWVTLVGENIY